MLSIIVVAHKTERGTIKIANKTLIIVFNGSCRRLTPERKRNVRNRIIERTKRRDSVSQIRKDMEDIVEGSRE